MCVVDKTQKSQDLPKFQLGGEGCSEVVKTKSAKNCINLNWEGGYSSQNSKCLNFNFQGGEVLYQIPE